MSISIHKYLLISLFILFGIFFIFSKSFAATEFVSSIMQSGGEYSSLNSWNTAMASGTIDLTTSTTKVLSHSGIVGTIADGSTINGVTSNATGTVVHVTATQILLKNIIGTFQSGEQLRRITGNYVTSTDAGTSTILTAKIDGAWTIADTTAVTIQNATTSATNYIRIYTTTAARHQGKWDTNKYRLEIATGSAITSDQDYITFDGLQINPQEDANIIYGINLSSPVTYTISNTIIKGNNRQRIQYGISSSEGVDLKIFNNIIYDFPYNDARGISIALSYLKTGYVYNNTLNNVGIGIFLNNNYAIAKNNLITSSTASSISGTFSAGTDYNATASSTMGYTVTGGGNTHDRLSQTFTFVDEVNKDFHLTSNDAGAKNYGADLSADANLAFSTDIDGQARPYGSAWDIGADENYTPSNPSSLGSPSLVNGSWVTSTQPQFTFTQSDANASNTQQYRIQISTSSSFTSQSVDYTSSLLSQTSTSFTVGQAVGSGTYTIGTSSQTLSDGQYYWRVMSTDNYLATSSYATANSGSIAFGVDATAPAGTIPAPTFGTITSSSIIINRPSTSTITESGSGLYQWQVRRNSTTTLSAVSTSTATTSDSSLTSNTQYTYDVRFTDLLGNTSSYGATSSKYTLTPNPTNLSATPSQTSNALSVDSFNNASSGSSGYYFSNTTNSNNSGWITTNSWTDTGLTCNTSYTYTIKYRNGDATESATSSLSQTTSACTVSSAVANAGLPISILSPISTNINKSPSTSSNISVSQYPSISFTKYLYPGLSNPEVKNFQQLLSNYSDIYPEALITGYFGPLTKKAVQRFQLKYGITDQSDKAFGLVGPKTRKILNLLEQINYLQSQINQILSRIKKSS